MASLALLLVILLFIALILGYFFFKNRTDKKHKWESHLSRGVKDLGVVYEARNWMSQLHKTIDLEEDNYFATLVEKFYSVGATEVEVCLTPDLEIETTKQIEALIIKLPFEEKCRVEIFSVFNSISSQLESDIKQDVLIYWLSDDE